MKPYYYVYRVGNLPPKHRHASLNQAKEEAERLAARHPGEAFEILKCIGITMVPSIQTFWMDGVMKEIGRETLDDCASKSNPFNMTTQDYEEATARTAQYPDAGEGTERAINYCLLGFLGEAGELANKFKKTLRGDRALDRKAMLDELGDCQWYITRLALELGGDLESIMEYNTVKLMSRQERGLIKGDGDNR